MTVLITYDHREGTSVLIGRTDEFDMPKAVPFRIFIGGNLAFSGLVDNLANDQPPINYKVYSMVYWNGKPPQSAKDLKSEVLLGNATWVDVSAS